MDKKYIKRTFELALLGIGNVSPNPMVGAVVVYKNKIIGESYHKKFGGPHAEVNAINSVKNKNLLKYSTIYVNLEPCSHHGKTPPCTDLIIKNKIKRVVISCKDSFAKVSGNGIKKLKNAGIEVTFGILEKEGRELNRRFFTFHEIKRPYIILKWAQTMDGFIDIIRNKYVPIKPIWITNELARTLVHKYRTEEDAIMVGTNTCYKDNPKLNVRDWSGKNPTRILLDRHLRLNKKLFIFDKSIPTIVFTEKENTKNTKNLEFIKIQTKQKVLDIFLDVLYEREIMSVIIEGGYQLHKSFIQQNLWDEARIFIGNKFFHKGIPSANISGRLIEKRKLLNSKLFIYRNKKKFNE